MDGRHSSIRPIRNISLRLNWHAFGVEEDVACEQSDHNGVPPLVVPNILDHVWPSIPQALWDDVVVILPWALYLSPSNRGILH